MMSTPTEPPPSHDSEEATSPDSLPQPETVTRNGIPLHARRSMEDELRPLPAGWVREFDPETQHQFFVDTLSRPPRSVWHHPYDDETFLGSLAPDERARVDDMVHPSRHRPNLADVAAAEHEMYRQHRLLRRAMRDAMRSGRPQPLGRDENRVRVFLEPPGHTFPGVAAVRPLSPYLCEVVYDHHDDDDNGGRRRRRRHHPGPPGRYLRPEGDMYGFGYGGYGCGRFSGGRWDRPAEEYHRPEGRGAGGGLGLPLMAPLGGGMVLRGVGEG